MSFTIRKEISRRGAEVAEGRGEERNLSGRRASSRDAHSPGSFFLFFLLIPFSAFLRGLCVKKNLYLPILLILSTFILPLIPLQAQERTQIIYAFRSYTRPEPIRMILVGEIQSKTKAAEVHDTESPFRGYDTRQDQVMVKVTNRTGLKVGQKLYVIEKNPFHQENRNGLIVGEITVSAILYNPFYGWVVTGTGILLRVRIGQFIARTLASENLERARVLKRNGDHHFNRGDIERAMTSYNSAVEADNTLPEAHAALGRVYLNLARRHGEQTPIRALAEFELAWKNKENFQYTYDELEFYKDFMDALHYTYALRRLESSRQNNLVRHLDRLLEVGQSALSLKSDLSAAILHMARAQYHRMNYYKNQSSPEERRKFDEARMKAGEYMQQLMHSPPPDSEAYRIGALYYSELYTELSGTITAAQQVRKNRLRELVGYCVKQYHLYLDERRTPADAAVDRALRLVED